MRDLVNKMAELKFEAPLAQFEETDEWGPIDYQSANLSLKAAISDTINLNVKDTDRQQQIFLLEEAIKDNNCSSLTDSGIADIDDGVCMKKGGVIVGGSPNRNTAIDNICSNNSNDGICNGGGGGGGTTVDNFTETFGGSLEDLVNTFDEKITKCFGNYEQSVEELAPVQVRSQEEIMNECQ